LPPSGALRFDIVFKEEVDETITIILKGMLTIRFLARLLMTVGCSSEGEEDS
jgi:hypothetical protein